MKIKSLSPAATKKLAAELAKKIMKLRPKSQARVVGLVGDLGGGKTVFVKGFAKMLGVKQKITSPTFLIFRSYELRSPPKQSFTKLYHADLYRLRDFNDLKSLGFKEILKNPLNIVVIEWAERIKKHLPKNSIWVKFEHGAKQNERIIRLH